MDRKEIDNYIKQYILTPYKIRIIEARQDYDKAIKGKSSAKDTNKVKELYKHMEKIENIIDSDDIKKIELFRLDCKEGFKKFGLTKNQIMVYKRRVRNKVLEAIEGL